MSESSTTTSTLANKPVSIPSALSKINKHWSPKLIGSLNSAYEIKVVKLLGEFVWHSHDDTDEVFYILEGGPLTIQFAEEDGGDVVLEKGDLFVVPKGVRHCPKTDVETSVMLIEPTGVVNTGDAEKSELTAAVEDFR